MKYNILYLHSHDTGRYIAPYGHAVPTPNLMAFAKEATLFRQAFCAAPTCSPSRAALLTGQNPHSAGMLGLAHRGHSLKNTQQHLAHYLLNHGYQTLLVGLQHVIHEKDNPDFFTKCGYSQLIRGQGQSADFVSGAASQYLQSKPTEPFFLDAGFFETHRPFPSIDPDIDPQYLLPPESQPDTVEVREDFAAYHTMVRRLDEAYGKILNTLKAVGLAERTIVVITTDHGLAFPKMKCNLNSDGTGVLFLLKGPAIPRGSVSDSLISHLDLFPTLCDLLNLPKPAWLEGKSLTPVLKDSAAEVHDVIFTEVTHHASFEPMRSARSKRFVYIKRFKKLKGPIFPNIDDCSSKKILFEAEWKEASLQDNEEEFYDRLLDPQEKINQINHTFYKNEIEFLKTKLKEWMERTRDPLLSDEGLFPPGIISTDASHYSPEGVKK